MISGAGMNANAEGSESNSSKTPCPRNNNATSDMGFKGVVLQQNGNWGAQIYANHQRIWLGTFKSEKEAAMAYDSAAIKLRSGDSHRNFPWTNLTIQEPNFQDLHTADSVLNMIKDGSYQSKFTDFLRSRRSLEMGNDTGFHHTVKGGQGGGILCQQLFQKELTPSDVGKLNRLVIPKKHAIKYFPQVSEVSLEEDEEGSGVDDIQLIFFDRWMKSWMFRYCYWKSSQSFVFTRGWNRFVKEKELKAKDVVTFYRCERREASKEERTFCMIDVGYNRRDSSSSWADGPFGLEMELKLGLGQNFECGPDQEEEKVVMEVPTSPAPQPIPPPRQSDAKGIRIFGVQIR
ncbi:hypothetical protein NE237_006478 [Protea cynaroides]|uniref:AP2/ERF and B3 domain-containing transcription factor n=1 Tax=Protea cynaroides TaxID=273540 RepID=A0A9Q0QVJ9_9MAGN|nr:hypothetical protein NE237_006478 [Protea cynaroides]